MWVGLRKAYSLAGICYYSRADMHHSHHSHENGGTDGKSKDQSDAKDGDTDTVGFLWRAVEEEEKKKKRSI